MGAEIGRLRVLHLEDKASDAILVSATLRAEGLEHDALVVETRAAFIEALKREDLEVILSDYSLPSFDGLAALELARATRPEIPFIFVSGTMGEDVAVECLRNGATDYVLKERLSRLAPAVRRAAKEAKERAARQRAERALAESERFIQQVMDATPNLVYVFDRTNLCHVYVNNQMAAVLGYAPEAIIGMGRSFFDDLIHPEDQGRLVERLAQLDSVPEGEIVETQYRIKNSSGQWRWLNSRDLVFALTSGHSPHLVLGTAEDVTARQRAQEHLATQDAVTEVLASAPTREEALVRVLECLSHGTRSQLGEIWRVDAESSCLRLEALWHGSPLPTSWVSARRATSVVPGPGLLGRVWSSGRPQWLKDAAQDKDSVQPFGAPRAFAFPIRSGKNVIGAMSFHGVETLDPDDHLLEMLDTLSQRIGDFMEMKKGEEALRESEERYRSLVTALQEGVILLDAAGIIRAANKSAEHILGVSTEELIGTSSRARRFRALRDDGSPIAPEELPWEVALRTGNPLSNLVLNLSRSDGALWVSVNAQPLTRGDGSPYAAVVSFVDITDRREADRRIREQAALLDEASDAIVVLGEDGRITYWSKGAERVYGWTAQASVGQDAEELLQERQTRTLLEAHYKISKGESWTGLLTQVRHDGKEITVESRWTPLRREDGRGGSLLIINSDVTETKRLEAQFLRAQRLEGIGALAGGLAHDLNNVLAPILMAVTVLKRKFPDAQGQRILSTIDMSTRRGADIVRQVLTFARGLEGQRGSVDVSELIREMERMARETFPKTIQVDVHSPGDLWAVSGLATPLQQVLLNLCVNARDAMPGGGVISITASNVRLEKVPAFAAVYAKPGPHVRLAVRDTGAGMPPAVLDRIFSPFFTTKAPGEGTGLGLSTSLAIVKSHGGFLEVDSRVGHGTEFRVYIPALLGPLVRETRRQAPSPAFGNGELILVIDDEASIREITRETLETHGYRVVTAGDGREALALYARKRGEIDLVLTDLAMPNMDGAETIRALLSLDPSVEIVAMSGLMPDSDPCPGVKASLAKPYTAEALLKCLQGLLGSKTTP